MKKIDYSGIPNNVLDIVLGETYGLGDYTLKDEIDKFGEDLITHRYNIRIKDLGLSDSYSYIEWFHAWSDKHVFVLVDSIFGDRILLSMDRNPPKELSNVRRTNKKDKRSKPRRSRKAGRK